MPPLKVSLSTSSAPARAAAPGRSSMSSSRAPKPTAAATFPALSAPPTTAGIGTTHVLAGAAVSVFAEMTPDPSRSATGRVLEMSGGATAGSAYSKLCHLLVVPQTKPGLPRSAVLKAYRVASVKVAVHLARAALEQTPASTQTFEPIGAEGKAAKGCPGSFISGRFFRASANRRSTSRFFMAPIPTACCR